MISIFNKHEGCIGLTLFRAFRFNIEIWFCPKGYSIKPHSHPEEHIELMYIYGRTVFHRISDAGIKQFFEPEWYHIFNTFTVARGTIHWFEVSDRPLIFINIAKFKKGHKPKSAAKDFKETDYYD